MMKIKMRVFCWLLWMFCAIRTEALGPAMSLVVQLGASVTLPCSVDTPLPLHLLEVQWRREDSGSLVHLFQEGESRPESQSPAYSGRADFFSEDISKGNFSLLLRNVTTEDKGLYKCVVRTEHESHETEVTIDIVKSNTAVLLYCLQVSVPCILMSIAFAIWGYIESSFAEAYTCSAINLTRILVLFKVAPYVLPGTFYKRFTNLALPLENFVIRTGINSAVLYNFLTYQAPDAARKFFCGFTFALVLLYDLSAVCISGIKFSSGYDYLSYIIDTELFFLIFIRSAYGFTVGKLAFKTILTKQYQAYTGRLVHKNVNTWVYEGQQICAYHAHVTHQSKQITSKFIPGLG
ncbi:uncharacterized protein LOC135239108 isoform X2 [Anguilla rostrata]|uniref:uncharacterized protein LOC135239108 isoform X2 n=1 Tax=Anguilla rostrata TaxID=7938 RepID=UPI0030D000FD